MSNLDKHEWSVYRVKPEHWESWGITSKEEALKYLWEIRSDVLLQCSTLEELLAECEVVLRR